MVELSLMENLSAENMEQVEKLDILKLSRMVNYADAGKKDAGKPMLLLQE